jgi:branched-subunit amino acid transport protein
VTAVWIAVLAVGAASLAFRWLPMIAVHRVGLRPRTEETLRHAGAGAIAALVVLAVLRPGGSHGVDAAVLLAVAVGGLLAWRGRSMLLVVLAGGACFAVATLVARLL